MRLFVLSTMLFTVTATISLADGAHCHLRSEDGRLSDLPSASNPADCARQKGIWLHHHAHCHVKKNGKLVDALGVRDQAQCSSKGGEWLDHTHDGKHQ